MNNSDTYYQNLLKLLVDNNVEYRHFHHQPAYTYEQLLDAQKQTGFFGTEGKNMVLKTDEKFIVYVTIQGKRLNFDKVKETVGANKVKLATPEELKTTFGAEPGCAYPFGFNSDVPIYVDPIIYEQEWFLFSPVYPDQTIQAKGADLKNVFNALTNKVVETSSFSQ